MILNIIIMLSTIWDDINNEAESIPITDIKYDPMSLSNSTYDIIDNRELRHKLFKLKKTPNLYKDIDLIRQHRDAIEKDEDVLLATCDLFQKDCITSITSLDKIFINVYYRRLLRAKLERDYIAQELPKGLIVTQQIDIDSAIVETMQVLRIICKYLGVTSTTHNEKFSLEKLYMPSFWTSISNKLFKLFGENRIEILPEEEPLKLDSVAAVMMANGKKKILQSKVLMMLNIVFNAWSGSILVSTKDDRIQIVPATYVTRLLPKLNDIN